MCDTAFWRGMAAGMAAGAIIGMTVAEKRKAMKTSRWAAPCSRWVPPWTVR